MRFSLPDCKNAKEYAQRIRPMPLSLLRQMRDQRAVVVIELKEIEREIQRRESRMQPKKVLRISFDAAISGYCFETNTKNGLRRIYPPGLRPGEEVCMNTEDLRAWFKRLKVTHIESKFDEKKTSVDCIKDGTYSVASYLKWHARAGEEE